MEIDGPTLYRLLADSLKALRVKRKLTQTQLADRVNVARTTIANIETCQQRPPLHLLYAICAELGTEPDRILPRLADITPQQPVTVELDGRVLSLSPKAHQFLAKLDDL